jgi:hypothetical protein
VLRTAEATATEAGALWRALWVPKGLEPLAPAAVTGPRRARTEVLRRAEDAADVRCERDDLAAWCELTRTALAELLLDVPAQELLGAVLLRAETARAADEAKVAEYALRNNAVRDAEGWLPELQKSVDAAATAMEAWRQDWSTA